MSLWKGIKNCTATEPKDMKYCDLTDKGYKTAIAKWTQIWKIQVEKQKQYIKDSLNHQLKLCSITGGGGVWKAAATDRMA